MSAPLPNPAYHSPISPTPQRSPESPSSPPISSPEPENDPSFRADSSLEETFHERSFLPPCEPIQPKYVLFEASAFGEAMRFCLRCGAKTLPPEWHKVRLFTTSVCKFRDVLFFFFLQLGGAAVRLEVKCQSAGCEGFAMNSSTTTEGHMRRVNLDISAACVTTGKANNDGSVLASLQAFYQHRQLLKAFFSMFRNARCSATKIQFSPQPANAFSADNFIPYGNNAQLKFHFHLCTIVSFSRFRRSSTRPA